MINIKHFRHATSIIELGGKRILIDPVFAPKGSYPPIMMTKNPKRNPLVDLPCSYHEILNVHGVLITHIHSDHFDKLAQEVLPKDIPILCQPSDHESLLNMGFTKVTVATENTIWLDIKCSSFIGSHGGGLMNKKLGVSSSFLLEYRDIEYRDIKTYITGDTLLTNKVKYRLKKLSPDFVIANAGGARFKYFGKITMNISDILKMNKLLNKTPIVVVHMDSINHCFDTRIKLKKSLSPSNNLIYIPNDGELIKF